MSGEITSWAKTKDALLVGAAAIGVLVAGKILADVTEIKTAVAVYQADAKAMQSRQDRQEQDLARLREEIALLRRIR